MKSFLLLLFIGIPQLAYSVTYSHTNGKSYYSRSTNPFNLEFLILAEEMKDRQTFKTSGIYNKFDTALTYSSSIFNDFRLFGAYVYQANHNEENDGYFELTEFMYRRNRIFSQRKNGFSMDLELKGYYVLDPRLRERWGFNSAFIPQIILRKRIRPWFSLSGKIRHHFNMRRGSQPWVTKEETRVYISPTFIFSRKFMFNTEFTWKHKNKVAKSRYYADEIDLLEVRPSLMYMFNYSVMGEIYTDTTLMKSHDGSFISKTADDEMVYGMGLYLSAF